MISTATLILKASRFEKSGESDDGMLSKRDTIPNEIKGM